MHSVKVRSLVLVIALKNIVVFLIHLDSSSMSQMPFEAAITLLSAAAQPINNAILQTTEHCFSIAWFLLAYWCCNDRSRKYVRCSYSHSSLQRSVMTYHCMKTDSLFINSVPTKKLLIRNSVHRYDVTRNSFSLIRCVDKQLLINTIKNQQQLIINTVCGQTAPHQYY